MGFNFSNCSVFDIFLGFLVGLAFFLLAILGAVAGFLGGIGLGAIAGTVANILAVIGFLVLLFLGYCILRKVWGCCFGRDC